MTKQFTPTKKQLEKLAEVADRYTTLKFGIILCAEGKWQPHKNRDQIAMVIEGLTDEQEGKYYRVLNDYWILEKNSKYVGMLFGQTVHPSISCEKLCEVIG